MLTLPTVGNAIVVADIFIYVYLSSILFTFQVPLTLLYLGKKEWIHVTIQEKAARI